jgi:hypothetical protein
MSWDIIGFLGLPVIYTIFGVIVGSILGFILQYLNEKRREKRQNNSIKAALKIDINKNIHLLEDLCKKIKKYKNQIEVKHEHIEYYLAEYLSNLDLVKWEVDMWKKKNPLIFMALSDIEINEMENFYDNLELISSLQKKMNKNKNEILNETKKISTKSNPINEVKVQNLINNLLKSWKNFNKTTSETIRLGTILRVKF